MKKIVREYKDDNNTEYDLQHAVCDENLFHLFDFFDVQLQSDRKHQKYDTELIDEIEWIVAGTVEPKKGADNNTCSNIADNVRYPQPFENDVKHGCNGYG